MKYLIVVLIVLNVLNIYPLIKLTEKRIFSYKVYNDENWRNFISYYNSVDFDDDTSFEAKSLAFLKLRINASDLLVKPIKDLYNNNQNVFESEKEKERFNRLINNINVKYRTRLPVQ